MKIIEPSVVVLKRPSSEETLQIIELAGRTCYKSEDKITPESASKFVTKIAKVLKHESVLEHISATVRFIVDRGVSHELVRHRLASFSQESTRYCNYCGDKFGNEITVVRPCFWEKGTELYWRWELACKNAEAAYIQMLDKGASPQEARSVLPNSLKTEVVVTANLREWKHIFNMRTSEKAHPQMRQVMIPLFENFKQWLPEIYEA